MTEWMMRCPDLAGKTIVMAAGSANWLSAVAQLLGSNGARLAIVAADHDAVVAASDAAGVPAEDIQAVTADPADPQLWQRVLPHIEQRLGPIDVAVAMGSPAQRRALLLAAGPDMQRRGRGVMVEVGAVPRVSAAAASRRRHVVARGADAVAAAVLLCCSDSLPAADVTIRLG